MDSIEKFRESIFAVKNMHHISAMTGKQEFSDGALQFSLQHSWYHQIINSLAWELEIPFSCCFAKDILKDFPLKRVDDFKKNVRKVRRIGSHQTQLDKAIDKLTDVEAFALIENDNLRDIINASVEIDDDFAEISAHDHLGEVMEEILEKLPDMGNSLDRHLLDFKTQEFNEKAWDLLSPLKTSIHAIITDSWGNHALYLADAMTTFDFKSNRARIGEYLAFENAPEEVSRVYLESFREIGDRCLEIIAKLKNVNEQLDKIEIKENGRAIDLTLPKQRYRFLEERFQVFAERVKSTPDSTLSICNCSPAGFLNDLMPPV